MGASRLFVVVPICLTNRAAGFLRSSSVSPQVTIYPPIQNSIHNRRDHC